MKSIVGFYPFQFEIITFFTLYMYILPSGKDPFGISSRQISPTFLL